MNRLGFYIENTTTQFLRDAINQVKPPTILIHAQDRGLLRDIRTTLSPNSFVVGRLFVDLAEQTAWLDSPDPAAAGRAFAERILAYDFGMATEKANGRLLIDTWMSLNESLPGPGTFPGGQPDAAWQRRAAAYDQFQVAFRETLMRSGVEALAFNFAAGNFARPEDYTRWFPRTLATYVYLGFHEYGWPTLEPTPVTATGALLYRPCMTGIRAQYGDRHRAIISEAGLARMYKYPNDGAGDVGWLYPPDSVPQASYWNSLQWYNSELLRDSSYVLGCCLFQVGHAGRWETFRHLGLDNNQQPITIISNIATLNQIAPPPPPPPPQATTDLATLQRQIRILVTALETAQRQLAGYTTKVTGLQTDLSALAVAAQEAALLPQQVTGLQARLGQQLLRVNAMQASGQISAAHADTLRARIADLRSRVDAVQPAAQQAAQLDTAVRQAQSQMPPLSNGATVARQLKPQVDSLLAEARRLASDADATAPVRQPEGMEDVRDEPTSGRAARPLPPALTDHLPVPPPVGAGNGYPTRSLSDITQIIVHQTNTRDDVSPERLAEMDAARGLPGVRYHFLIDGDGASYWMEPLEAVLPQTQEESINVTGVALALAGNFSKTVPSDAQLQGAAEVIAWLLYDLNLPAERVFGRSEVEPGIVSPGAQWLQGAVFKDDLMARVRLILEGRA